MFAVRAAAAASLGALAGRVHEIVLAPLISLLEDPERTVRMAAAEALIAYIKTGASLGNRAADLDKKLTAEISTGDPWASDPGCYLTDEEIGLTPTPTAPEPLAAAT